MRSRYLPTVQPASIEEDLSRRDFTINAIAIQLNPRQFGRLLDPMEGSAIFGRATIRVLHSGSFQDDPRASSERSVRTTVRFPALRAPQCACSRKRSPQNLIQHSPVRD